jgi:hypothetical protein
MQPIAADEVVAFLADVALGAPLNATMEIGGPEAIPLDARGEQRPGALGRLRNRLKPSAARCVTFRCSVKRIAVYRRG